MDQLHCLLIRIYGLDQAKKLIARGTIDGDEVQIEGFLRAGTSNKLK